MNKYNLLDISRPKQWKTISSEDFLIDGKYSVYGANGIIGKTNTYNHLEETVLITCRGATCGKINLSEPYSYINGNAMSLDDLDKSIINTKYLFYYLQSYNFNNVITGSAQPQITRESLRKVKILAPDLDTQDKIVTVLDKAKNLIDKREQTIYRFDELLRATFLDMFGDPFINEKGWTTSEIGNKLITLTSGSRGWAKYYADLGSLFLRINNLGNNELLLNNIIYVNEPDTTEAIRTKVKVGDVLLSITADLGRTAVIPLNFQKAFVNQHIAILRPNAELNPYFLSSYLSSAGGKQLIMKYSKGAAKAGLNFDDIKSIKIFETPKLLQEKFEKIYLKIHVNKQKLVQSKTQLENLLNGLSQIAFNGELLFNTAVDLEILMENEFLFFKENSNSNSIQLLLERIDKDELNKKKFYEQDMYNKAKGFVFELLKEGKVKQIFDEKTKKVKLSIS